MSGFALDYLIRTLVRGARRNSRQQEAEEWKLAQGSIKRFEAQDKGWNDFHPVISYAYDVNGETNYGVATGFELDRSRADEVAVAVDALGVIWVRYDPSDPYQNRILNADNPKLPFEVDLAEGS